jgi:hypothetical protein
MFWLHLTVDSFTVASAAFVTAMILSAYMNWIDPEIANLQPTNSYWLMIRAVIV